MQTSQSQKKVIELFRTFFERIVLPSVKNQPMVMEEWKHLISMVSEDKIDTSKVDLYVKMLNHTLPVEPSQMRIDQSENNNQRNDRTHNTLHGNYSPKQYSNSDRQTKELKDDIKKKMLSALQAFHNSLIQNQQKFEQKCQGGTSIKQTQQRRYR